MMLERPLTGSLAQTQTTVGSLSARRSKDWSIEQMEKALEPLPTRRPAECSRPGQASHTARAFLEENRAMIEEKRERKAMQRKKSREYVEKLLVQDMAVIETNRARELHKKLAQKELAQYYKARIAEREQAKAGEYQSKVAHGRDPPFFPFVEGENIDRSRQNKLAALKDELRVFLQEQRDAKPPRADSLIASTSVDNGLEYPIPPRRSVGAPSSQGGSHPPSQVLPALSTLAGTATSGLGADLPLAPHLNAHPKFLTRAQEVMSRRQHETHVKAALEEKVQQTKAEIARLEAKKRLEAAVWEDGLLVHDAVQFDTEKLKAEERRQCQDYLKQQIEDRKKRSEEEKEKVKSEIHGYWGPEEKEAQDPEFQRELCTDLIKQMEVDQMRKMINRNQRLRQERRMVDNCLSELSHDREKERQKVSHQREVLLSTWDKQQKLKEAMKHMECW